MDAIGLRDPAYDGDVGANGQASSKCVTEQALRRVHCYPEGEIC